MAEKYYKWILNCVHDYFSFVAREFESKELGLKLSIGKNMKDDYYIEFRHNDKISILTGGHKLSKGQMIDLLEDSFIKDFKYPKTVDIDKVYNFISKSVYSLDGTYRQSFRDKDLDIKIQIYTHALSSESFDYWIKANGKSEKIYVNTNCKLAEDLIDKIYSSYINDFLTHEPLLNDPLLYAGHLNNKIHTLMHQLEEEKRKVDELEKTLNLKNSKNDMHWIDRNALMNEIKNLREQLQEEDKDRQIYELKDKNSHLLGTVSDLKRINESIIIDNNKKTKENYELRSELKRLFEDLQEEKNAHTTTQCRAIFAKHILNGDRDEKAKEFKNANNIDE